MAVDFKKRTEFALRDLHARESMRLGWYRQWGFSEDKLMVLRERKARHEAFLKDLLRQRGLNPAWYSRFFYLSGHFFGLVSAIMPEKWVNRIEKTLEFWILLRYQDYFRKLKLDFDLRSMIESIQLKKMNHDEPGIDVLSLLEQIIQEEEERLATAHQ